MKSDSESTAPANGSVAPTSVAGRDVSWLLPVAVLIVGWAFSGWIFFLLQRDTVRRQEEYFSERVAEAQAAIRVRMTTYVDALRGGTSYFTASKSVDRDEWRIYAASLQLDVRYPGINGLGVIFAVPPDRLSEWQALVRVSGEPERAITPFPDKTDQPGGPKYLITYLEGNVAESLPIGRNIATEPSRRKAAELARDTGEPQLHQRLPGSRDMQRRSGLILYVPLYAKDAPLTSVAERRAASIGWIYAQVYPDIFLDGVLGPMGETLRLHFFETEELSPERLLYSSVGQKRAPATFERVTQMKLAGQTFQLGWQRGPRFPSGGSLPAVWTGGSLALATLLLAGLVTSLQSVGRRANAIASERTMQLAASEERFRTLAASAPVGIFEADPAGRCVYVNPRWEELTGLSAARATGEGWFGGLHPADRAAVTQAWEALWRGEQPFTGEYRFVRPDGKLVWVAFDAIAIKGAQGTLRGYLGTVTDRTAYRAAESALRESEERTRLFAEHAPAAVAMFDREMRYLVVSREWMAAYHVTGDIIGRSHYEMFPEIGEKWKAIHQRCLAGAVETAESDMFLRSDGSKQWLRWEVRPWFLAGGGIGGIVMFTEDISERIRLEERLAEARDEALAASRLKSEFLATMSHEIRTPMNAIIGMTAMLADSKLPPEQTEMTRVLLSSAEGLLTIINDILDYSKIEAGKLRLDPADFDLRRVVDETIALFAPRAEGQGLAFTAVVALGEKLELRGDGGRVRQILSNLLGNAVKFTERGAIRVEASIVRERESAVQVRVAVQDTGIGIAADVQPKLFQPFVQGTDVGVPRGGGTGLGLAICRQLVRAMGGDIGVQSEPGKGSTFWFTMELPRVASAATLSPVAADAALLAATRLPEPEPAARKLRLLMAEDNLANQAVGRMLLARLGFHVDIVENGVVALERLAQSRYDAVLMDCQMPVLDGYETTRRIRAGLTPGVDPTVPIIAVTAYAMREDRGRCLEAGMDDYISKPIRVAELRAALDRCGLRQKDASMVETAAPPSSDGDVLDPRTLRIARTLPGTNGPSLLPELMAHYLASEGAVLAALEECVQQRDFGRLAERAHGMAGDVAALGGLALRDTALALEKAARASDALAIRDRLAKLRVDAARLRAALGRLNVNPP